MGRELRRVPADWEHPKDRSGRYISLYDETFAQAAAQWKADYEAFYKDRPASASPDLEYWEWDVGPPKREYYRPEWTEETRTHFQMYENTTEGTPISPVMDSPEAVARWCAENHVSYFGDIEATYEDWLKVCEGTLHGFLVFTVPKQ